MNLYILLIIENTTGMPYMKIMKLFTCRTVLRKAANLASHRILHQSETLCFAHTVYLCFV